MVKEVHIYVDGGCYPNPGPGGWGVVFVSPAEEVIGVFNGQERDTTNNRMELTAAIRSLELMMGVSMHCVVYTDSSYVFLGITKYVVDWKRKNWLTSAGKDVKNRDLWEILYKLDCVLKPTWKKVRGHSGNKFNDMADEAASAYRS